MTNRRPPMNIGTRLLHRGLPLIAATFMCVAFAGPVSAMPDTTPPQLVGFSFSPTSADVGAGDVNVTFTLHITDPLSGFDGGGQVSLLGPGGTRVNGGQYVRLSGTAFDGTYQVDASIPQY